MKVFPSEVKRIMDTLPIGFYAGKRVPTRLSETEESSYYNTKEDSIVISFPQIETALSEVKDINYLETGIRSTVYHEVSHAILTPEKMEWSDIINVFEDERIETVLAGYYHNVDFKQNIIYINNYHGEAPKNAFEKYYYTVRFRQGNPDHIDELKKIIREYRSLDFTISDYNPWKIEEYVKAIKDFYRLVTGEEPSSETSRRGCPQPSSSSQENTEGTNSAFVLSDADVQQFDKKAVENILQGVEWNKNFAKPDFRADPKLVESIAMLFDNFRRKTGGGAAIQGYSGILNPRNVAREDYKYFDRFAKKTGTNKFGTVHLNLFLDTSGSFSPHERKANSIVIALEEMEKRNPFFTFDVVSCGHGENILRKENRFIKCIGGNLLDEKIYEIFRLLQKPNTYNYNIVLFDGDAYSDASSSNPQDTFRAFNVTNCTIISEDSNRKYIESHVNRAKVIFTEEYEKYLLENVLNTLSLALH